MSREKQLLRVAKKYKHKSTQQAELLRKVKVRMVRNVVEFQEVKGLRKDKRKNRLLCQVKGQTCWLSLDAMDLGNKVWEVGDSGTLIITEWEALLKGLL